MRSTSSPSTNSGGVTVSLHACRLHWSIDNVEREFYLHMWNFCGGFFVNAKTLSRAKTHLLSRNIGPLAIVRKRGKPFMYGTFVDFIWKLDVFRMAPVIYHRAHIVLVLFRRDFVLFFVHLTTTSFIVAPFPSGFFLSSLQLSIFIFSLTLASPRFHWSYRCAIVYIQELSKPVTMQVNLTLLFEYSVGCIFRVVIAFIRKDKFRCSHGMYKKYIW